MRETRKMRPRLPYNVSWADEALVEWVDGFLLGDGHLALTRVGDAARASISTKHPEWTDYAMIGFKNYQPKEATRVVSHSKVTGKSYDAYQSASLAHPDLKVHRDRWYPQGKKIVPADVRLTPTSLRLFYLGDGCFSKGDVELAAVDFTEDEVAVLACALKEKLGLEFHPHLIRGKRLRLRLVAEHVHRFFDVIGKDDPTGCYGYKFDLTQVCPVTGKPGVARNRNTESLAELAKELGVTSGSWIRWVLQSGRVELDTTAGVLRPTEKGKAQLRELVEKEYMPHGAESPLLSQDDVLKDLRIHSRRIPVLIQQAGISPRKTPGGQWRFTREDVEKMRAFSEKRRCAVEQNANLSS